MKIVVVSYDADQGQTFFDLVPVRDELLADYPMEERVKVATDEAVDRVDRGRGRYAQVIDSFVLADFLRMAQRMDSDDEAEADVALAELFEEEE